jgi:hypothetical protein
MVTLIRTAEVSGVDKRQKALEWAKTAAEYVNGEFGLSRVEVGIEAYGHVGRVFWIERRASNRWPRVRWRQWLMRATCTWKPKRRVSSLLDLSAYRDRWHLER